MAPGHVESTIYVHGNQRGQYSLFSVVFTPPNTVSPALACLSTRLERFRGSQKKTSGGLLVLILSDGNPIGTVT
jgi:hypothetical protein